MPTQKELAERAMQMKKSAPRDASYLERQTHTGNDGAIDAPLADDDIQEAIDAEGQREALDRSGRPRVSDQG